jgi:hypothetical protein
LLLSFGCTAVFLRHDLLFDDAEGPRQTLHLFVFLEQRCMIERGGSPALVEERRLLRGLDRPLLRAHPLIILVSVLQQRLGSFIRIVHGSLLVFWLIFLI